MEHVRIREILKEKGRQTAARGKDERSLQKLDIQKKELDKENNQLLLQLEGRRCIENEAERKFQREEDEKTRKHASDEAKLNREHQLQMKKLKKQSSNSNMSLTRKKLDDAKQQRKHEFEMKQLDDAKQQRKT